MTGFDHMTRKCGRFSMLAGVILLLVIGAPAHAQFGGETALGPANLKLGFNRSVISGATYSLTDASGATVSNSDSMTASDVYAEFILFSRFGVEINTALLAMEREYALNDASGALIGNVTETARPTTLSFNLYFQDQSTTGFKFMFGLGAGIVTVDHRFEGGTLGQASSNETVTINLMKFGVDWLTDKAGFRAQLIAMTGDARNGAQIIGFQQDYSYDATVATIGVFTFF